ncbi:MAG: hypothetical protein WAW96_15500, partial [Alphaproteobacteria bacterium]
FDLFFGLPGQRIIRSTELIAYYNFERSRPKFARAKSPADLPAPLQPIITSLRAERPAAIGDGVLGPSEGRYTLQKTSFIVSFATEQSAILRTDLKLLALQNEVLHCNVTAGGWIDAAKPKGQAKEITGFTSERGIMKYLSPEDRALLLDEDWFVPGRFFCIAPQPGQFMQILNQGGGYVIEFRANGDRPIGRTFEADYARVDKFLEGYLAGDNMNQGDYRFAPLTADAGPDSLPRDAEGRWMPARESILAPKSP